MPNSRHRGLPVTLIIVSCLGGLAIFAVVSLLLVSFEIAERNTVELTRDKAELTLDAIEARTQAHLSPVTAMVDKLADLLAKAQVGDNSPEELEEALRAALAATPQVSVIAFVDPEMDLIRVLRNRPGMPAKRSSARGDSGLEAAMADAREATAAFWGELYFAESVGQAFLNVYMPVYRASEFLGMLLVGISTKELSEFLSALNDDETATFVNAFILYDQDSVLAHPLLLDSFPGLSDEQPLPLVTKFGDPVLQDIWRSENHEAANPAYLGDFKAHGLRIAEQGYIFIYRELDAYGDVPWTIGTYFHASDIVSQVRRLDRLPWIAAGILVIALVLAVVLGRALSRPTRRLADAAAKIRDFDLDGVQKLPHSAMLEMNQAADAFDSMVAGLKSFETYVPRSLVKELIDQHGSSGVPSEERELTVLFTDIAGFTARTENLAANEVAAFLNEHFTLIGGCVLAEGGTIDKYIGDALMAFWGAPLPQDDTASRACRAALAMRAAIEADNDRRSAAGLSRVGVRIGVHTGPVVVGNIGLPGRINYTVVGDTVNSCQRLESLGKEVSGKADGDVTILISSATKALIDESFETVLMGDFTVKGREEALEVYRLVTGPMDSRAADLGCRS